MKKKILAAVVCAAAVLSLAGCGADKPITFDTPDSQTSEASSTLNISPVSKPGIWDNIPEIPVTADDAFKYEYNSDMGGMVITDYLKESPKVRIPDTLEDEPVVGVDLYDCEKQITELVMPDSVIRMKLSDTTEKSLLYLGMPADGFDYNVAAKYYPDYIGKMTADEFYEKQIEGGHYSFSGCKNLIAAGLSEKCSRFETLDGMIYYNYNGRKILLVCPQGRTESVALSKDVTEIGKYAFYNCKKLTSVTIPNSVTKIENNIFDGCENISVTYKGKTYDRGHIGEFYDLLIYGESMVNGVSVENGVLIAVSPNATAIIIPDNITEVDENLLYNCPKLETIQFKNKTYNWNNRNERDMLLAVFRGEEGLTIENGVLTAVDPNLTEVKIPDRVTGIMRDAINFPLAFQQCDKLKKVTFGNGISSIKGNYMLQPFIFTSIFGEYYENGCGVEEVIIPEGVTEVGDSAFAELSKLKTIKLPNSLTSIGIGAFLDCESLKDITIPDGVTSIAAPTTSETVTGLGHTLPGSPGAFDGCTNIKATYKGKTYDYTHIDDLYKAINGDTDGLTITSDGVLTKVDSNLTEVKIPDRVTKIANVPDTPAFSECTKLKKVTFGKGMTEISGSYFARSTVSILFGCDNLNEIIIPAGITYVGGSAFENLPMLEKVDLPEGLKAIGDLAFAGCTNLKKITIPDSVTQIAAYVEVEPGGGINFSNIASYGAFYNCENIKAIYKGKTYDHAHIDDLYKAINGN